MKKLFMLLSLFVFCRIAGIAMSRDTIPANDTISQKVENTDIQPIESTKSINLPFSTEEDNRIITQQEVKASLKPGDLFHDWLFLSIFALIFVTLITISILFYHAKKKHKMVLAQKNLIIAEYKDKKDDDLNLKITNYKQQIKDLSDQNCILLKEIAFWKNEANKSVDIEPEVTDISTQSGPIQRKLYANFINNNELMNVSDTMGDFSVFKLDLINSNTAEFYVHDSAIERVISRTNYLAGCEKEIIPGGKLLTQIPGIAHETGGKWVIDTPLKVKIT